MFHIGTRLLRATIAATAAGAMVLFTSSGAVAAAHPAAARTPVVQVVVTTAGGISMPSTVHAGIVTFRYTQGDADYHAVQGLRLKHGHSLSSVLTGFADALSGDLPTQAQGVGEINAGATLIGGALTLPTAAISVTVSLKPGTYYFIDYADFGVITPRVTTIQAVGDYRTTALPRFNKVIIAYMQDDMMLFLTPTSLSAKQTFFFYNASDEDHEVMFRPTTPGITDDYITTFYDAVLAGTTRPTSPWTGGQNGMNPLSPGGWAVVHIDLPPGPYAEICYVPDDQTGVPHGWEGMHQVVTLH